MLNVPPAAAWVRFPRFMGDAVMIHMALEPLRAAGIPLVPWGPGWVVDLFSEAPGYTAAVREDGPKASLRETVRMLKAARPSSLINLSRSQRSTLAAFLARVPQRVCWSESGGRLLGTCALGFRSLPGTQAERNRAMVRKAFPSLADPGFQPYRPRTEALETRDRQLKDLPALAGGYVGLSVGAASYNKRPPSPFLCEIGRLAKAEGLGVVVFGGTEEDRRLAAPILEALPGSLDRTGPMPLAERAAWVVGAKAFLTGDTGLGHVAAAAGVPTLVAFGPTLPAHYLPVGPKVGALQAEGLDCLGCGEGGCPLPGIPCMGRLDPGAAWAALKSLIR